MSLLEIEIYKLNGIAKVLQDLGYEMQSLEVAYIAHDLELKLSDNKGDYIAENFE